MKPDEAQFIRERFEKLEYRIERAAFKMTETQMECLSEALALHLAKVVESLQVNTRIADALEALNETIKTKADNDYLEKAGLVPAQGWPDDE